MNVELFSPDIKSYRAGGQGYGIAIGCPGNISFKVPAFVYYYAWVNFESGAEYQAGNLKIGNDYLEQEPENVNKKFNNYEGSFFVGFVKKQKISRSVGNTGTADDSD